MLTSHETSMDIKLTDFIKSLQNYYQVASFDLKALENNPQKTLENLNRFELLLVSNPKIKFKTKMCLMSAMIAWLCLPFCTSTIMIQFLFPFNIPLYLDCLQTWLGASATYLYVIGYIRQFPIHR